MVIERAAGVARASHDAIAKVERGSAGEDARDYSTESKSFDCQSGKREIWRGRVRLGGIFRVVNQSQKGAKKPLKSLLRRQASR